MNGDEKAQNVSQLTFESNENRMIGIMPREKSILKFSFNNVIEKMMAKISKLSAENLGIFTYIIYLSRSYFFSYSLPKN